MRWFTGVQFISIFPGVVLVRVVRKSRILSMKRTLDGDIPGEDNMKQDVPPHPDDARYQGL